MTNQPSALRGGPLPAYVWQPSAIADVLDRAASLDTGIAFHGGPRISYAGLREDAWRRLAELRGNARLAITPSEPRAFLTDLWACFLGGIEPVVAAPRYHAAHEMRGVARRGDSDDPSALLMLTSGSTGTPKLVRLTQRNIIASVSASAFVNGFTAADVSLNWLPLHHIGALMRSIRETYLGCEQIQVPTSLITADPTLWLELLDRYHATMSWAPNTAFASVVSRGTIPGTIDLSCVRSLYSSGEPVVSSTMRAFAELLAPVGLSRGALHTAWGMTEACFATFSHAAADSPSVGRPVPGVNARVVDGELEIEGPLVSPGYEGGETGRTSDGWLRTGDLATIRDGEILITGRRKDMIKIGGAAYGCREIEAAAADVADALAVAVEADGAETLALFVADAGRVHEVREAVARQCGITPRYVIPLRQRPVSETGKIHRAALRDAFAAGHFDDWKTWPFDLTKKPSALHDASDDERALARRIVAVMAEALDLDDLSLDDNFFSCGGSSLRVARTASRLDCALADLFHAPTPLSLARRLLGRSSSPSAVAGASAGARRRAARTERGRG